MKEASPTKQSIQFGPFLWVWGPVWLAMAILLMAKGYEESFLLIHTVRLEIFDFLMPHLTHFGDGLIAAGVAGLMLFRKPLTWFYAMLVSMLLIGALVWLGKHQFFPDWDRPVIVFLGQKSVIQLSLKPLFHHSFPSGHSAAAVAAFALPAFAHGRQKWGLTLLAAFISVIVAYSRIYIGVHFLGDVLAGSLLGAAVSGIVAYFGIPLWDKWLAPSSSARFLAKKPFWIGVCWFCLVGGIVRVFIYYYLP